jgi:hypothetical protein
MGEERSRMEKEERAKLGADAWKTRMKAVMEGASSGEVAEGQCIRGCGREVQPGMTPQGRPFKTCCRGCAMGFGHDLTCGKVDASKLGAGMCTNGCGRKVNEGTHPSGRPYTTCCRSCAKGFHDVWCGNSAAMTNLAPGMCKMGCGRAVAEGTGGRKFDTCCRGCATGKGHSKGCKG